MIVNEKKREARPVVVATRLDTETSARFEREAEKDGGRAEVLRRLIESYLKRRKVA